MVSKGLENYKLSEREKEKLVRLRNIEGILSGQGGHPSVQCRVFQKPAASVCSLMVIAGGTIDRSCQQTSGISP